MEKEKIIIEIIINILKLNIENEEYEINTIFLKNYILKLLKKDKLTLKVINNNLKEQLEG